MICDQEEDFSDSGDVFTSAVKRDCRNGSSEVERENMQYLRNPDIMGESEGHVKNYGMAAGLFLEDSALQNEAAEITRNNKCQHAQVEVVEDGLESLSIQEVGPVIEEANPVEIKNKSP